MEELILVDENDKEIGAGEKLEVHENGRLHRAISIFVLNSRGELMLQKRANDKYHSGGLWTNTCCGHPVPSETNEKAVHRKMVQEMGFDCKLEEVFSFIYKLPVGNGLTEHEYLHMFVGNYENDPKINLEEAEDWKWIDPQELEKYMSQNPENYTPWFLLSFPRVVEHLGSKKI